MEIKKQTANRPKTRHSFWIWFVVLGIFPLSIALMLTLTFYYSSQSLPSLENLERIEPPLISKVYDQDSVLIHEFYTERRIWTDYQDIPKPLIQAVISIEDRKFFSHWGVNLQAYPSALLPVLLGKRARGASTLTQQLAKNLFLTTERSVLRKLKELLLAIKVEQTYTKEEILEFYMNEVYLGGGAYGFQAGSQKYFSKPLDSLTIAQYALLAGLLPRPEAYRPDVSLKRSRKRRNLVLRAMEDEGFISKNQLKKSLGEKITLDVWQTSSLKAPYYVETIRQILEKKWNDDFIYGKGVNIYSSLDYEIQKAAEKALVGHLQKIKSRLKHRAAHYLSMPYYLKTPIDTIAKYWDTYFPRFDSLYINGKEEKNRRAKGYRQKFHDSLRYSPPQAAIIVIENSTGAIKALVGGENFELSKFNRALQSKRSPGSSFKAIVYAAAIDNGASPMDSLNDQPITIPDPNDPNKTWRPKNYGNDFSGSVTLRKAFYQSKNLPAIKLGIKYGLKTIASYARKFGLKEEIPLVPSIGIGAGSATLLEMTSAYSVFPNLGERPEPYFIETITDKNHQPIYRHTPKRTVTIRKETAYLMTSLLQDVNVRGTAASIRASGFYHPSGGKTGTTNKETDAWYIGFTKRYTAGVWVGIDNHKPMGRGHTGTKNAAPIWLETMRAAHKGLKSMGFPKPGRVQRFSVCQVTGQIAGAYCSHTASDYFIVGRQPHETCDGSHQVKKKWKKSGDLFSSGGKRVHSTIPKKKGKKYNKKKAFKKPARKTF